MFPTEKNEKSYSTYFHNTDIIVFDREPLIHLISQKKRVRGQNIAVTTVKSPFGPLMSTINMTQ